METTSDQSQKEHSDSTSTNDDHQHEDLGVEPLNKDINVDLTPEKVQVY